MINTAKRPYFPRTKRDEEATRANRKKRMMRYRSIQELKHKGYSIRDPHVNCLERRYEEGCHNAKQLWREIQAKGYPGAYNQVTKWMRSKRNHSPSNPGTPPPNTGVLSMAFPSVKLMRGLRPVITAVSNNFNDSPTVSQARPVGSKSHIVKAGHKKPAVSTAHIDNICHCYQRRPDVSAGFELPLNLTRFGIKGEEAASIRCTLVDQSIPHGQRGTLPQLLE